MRFSRTLLAAALAAAWMGTAFADDRRACLTLKDPRSGIDACHAAMTAQQWPVEELIRIMGALGNHLRSSGEHAAALDVYGKAIAMQPGDALLHAEAGRAHQLNEDNRAAIEAYTRAMRAGINDARIPNNRGVAYLMLGDPVSAIADFDYALSLDPNYGNAWNNRANALCASGQVEASFQDRIQALYAGRFTAGSAQTGLRKTGFYDGPSDGIWGPDSEDALYAWTAAGCPRAPKTRID